jgi:hypothetical protein
LDPSTAEVQYDFVAAALEQTLFQTAPNTGSNTGQRPPRTI